MKFHASAFPWSLFLLASSPGGALGGTRLRTNDILRGSDLFKPENSLSKEPRFALVLLVSLSAGNYIIYA